MMRTAIQYMIFFGLCFLINSHVLSQNSYSLQKALQTARANNPVLKTQYYNVGMAEADIVTAKLRPNPTLNNQSLQLAKQSYYPSNTGWSDGKNRQVWWQVTKPFQLPALRNNRIDVAKKNVVMAQREYSEVERALYQQVASKWVDVWTSKKQLDLLQLAKNNTDSLVSINQLRFKQQVITQTDLTRTELLANQYALQIKSAIQNYNNELLNLKYMLGVGENITIDSTDNFDIVFPTTVDSLLPSALETRSDVQALRSTIDVANSNIKLQKALAWPTPELGAIYNPQNTVPYIGFYGTIQIPIFSRNQGEIKKSQLMKQQSEQGLLTTQLQIQTEITTSYQSYQTQKANLENFKRLIDQATAILSNVKYAYLRGGTSIVDYLEAQRSWLDTQQQYYETLQSYRQSYIQLLYTSGLINQMAQ